MEKRGVIDEGTTPDMGPVRDDLDDVQAVKKASDDAAAAADDDLTRRLSKVVEQQLRQ